MLNGSVSKDETTVRDIVDDYEDSGLGLEDFARSVGVSPARLRYWLDLASLRRRLRSGRPNGPRD